MQANVVLTPHQWSHWRWPEWLDLWQRKQA